MVLDEAQWPGPRSFCAVLPIPMVIFMPKDQSTIVVGKTTQTDLGPGYGLSQWIVNSFVSLPGPSPPPIVSETVTVVPQLPPLVTVGSRRLASLKFSLLMVSSFPTAKQGFEVGQTSKG